MESAVKMATTASQAAVVKVNNRLAGPKVATIQRQRFAVVQTQNRVILGGTVWRITAAPLGRRSASQMDATTQRQRFVVVAGRIVQRATIAWKVVAAVPRGKRHAGRISATTPIHQSAALMRRKMDGPVRLAMNAASPRSHAIFQRLSNAVKTEFV
jgi:hypothetical protein